MINKILDDIRNFYEIFIVLEIIYNQIFNKMLCIRHERPETEPSEVFSKKGVYKNFTKFTGKDLCWSL